MNSSDVGHVVHSAAPYIGAVAAWMQGQRWGSYSALQSSRTGSPSSLIGGVMGRRLSRTPLLKRRGLIRPKRWTR